ncbi:RHS repeat-associated core domain-containing protein [Rapidithrix thailandica]|uniref:RHS repeat-associated core domain-containing protein n=1 Tax=Rapidithrix thailandica TaxID=413964 RepID=A0AAW9SHL6_9BACT
MITWVFDEGSFVPSTKITQEDVYSIVTDYIGKPIAAYNGVGNLVWEVEYDIYGNIRSQTKGEQHFMPFRYQGQYEDAELDGLMYNRFRYYDGNRGMYISQDPIGLAGNNPNIYGYVSGRVDASKVWGISTISHLLFPVFTTSPPNHLFFCG